MKLLRSVVSVSSRVKELVVICLCVAQPQPARADGCESWSEPDQSFCDEEGEVACGPMCAFDGWDDVSGVCTCGPPS